MLIGSRTHDFGKIQIKTLPWVLKKYGIEAAQIVLPKGFAEINSYQDVTEGMLEEIKGSFARNQIKISILGCYMDLGNPNHDIRTAAVDTFKKCLLYGKYIEADVVGTETAYPRLTQEEKKDWFPYMMDSVKRLAEEAEKVGQNMALEPVYWHPLDSIEVTKDVFESIDSRRVKMIFDPANLLKDTSIEQNEYYGKWLEEFKNVIEVIHMKDFLPGKEGQYIPVPLGTGIMEYDEVVKWCKKNKPDIVVIREELNPENARSDIKHMKELWR